MFLACLSSSPRIAAAMALLFTLLVACAACAPQDRLAEARKQQAAGNFAATIEPLRELLAEDRRDPELNYLYGLALVRTGQRGLAEWSLRRALEDPEWRLPAGRLLAFGEMTSGNYEPAIATLTELIEAYPDDLELLMMRANARAHSRMHLEDALADSDRILELDPDNVDVMEPRILALLGLDRIEEAGEAIDDLGRRIAASELESELAGWHCATAALFAFESNELELAEERWTNCTERFPGNSNVVSNALDYYDGRGEFERSLALLERAVEARPDSRDFRVHLAQRLRARGRSDEARDLLLGATEEQDDLRASATAWFDLAKHYQEVGDDQAAVGAFEKSLERVQESGVPLDQMQLQYADALLLARNYARALEVAETISVSAYREVIRARVAQEQGDPEKALQHFEETFRLWPDNPWARYYAALAAEAVGDFDRAVASYRDSIRIAPGATDARTRLARLHLSEGKPQEAIYIQRVQAETSPLELAGELLTLQIWGRLGNTQSIRIQLGRILERSPQVHGPGLEAAAQGLADRSGPAAAIQLIRETEGVDLTSPSYAAPLRQLVRFSSELGSGGAADEVRAALAAHPDSAALHEIEGLRAELAGERAAAAAAYERALSLDPELHRARVGLCRIAPEAAPESVLACRRALEASPADPDASLAAARALAAQGQPDEAVGLLESALQVHPYDAALATALADRLAAAGSADSGRIQSLRKRAERFTPSAAPAATHGPAAESGQS